MKTYWSIEKQLRVIDEWKSGCWIQVTCPTDDDQRELEERFNIPDYFMSDISPRVILLAKGDRGYWLNKRSKLLNDAQDLMLDIYLRGNNVSGGRKSYSGVIGLIMAWEEKKSAQRPR